MNTPLYDIAISGAGPVGSAIALALARKSPHPERIALVGTQFKSAGSALTNTETPALDPRTLAMNHGSRVLLEQLGAWPTTVANIHTVHVSQRGHLGRTVIKHTELGVPRLGSVASYNDLLDALHKAVDDSGITRIAASTGQAKLLSQHTEFDTELQVVASRVAIQSDGTKPKGMQRNYQQHAILATVQASHPAPYWAYERFTSQGPLALLPHPQGPGIYAVVWCCPPDKAAELLALDDNRFTYELGIHFGSRLGEFTSLAPRHVFPLTLHAGPSLIHKRCVAVGNAAQTLHPVAGQGLNLGLRDVAQLAQALAPWLLHPDKDPEPYLASFANRRRPDRWLTATITDVLPRVFATGNPLINHSGGLALLGMDMLPLVRKSLAAHLLQGLRT